MPTVDLFLEAVSKQRSREFTTTYWPLSPVQINPYFEAEQAFDIYNIIQQLSETKSNSEIGKLFGWPAVLRNFMLNSGIVGLKTACKVGLATIAVEERVAYLEKLIAILGTMVTNDPLCSDGKSLILDENSVSFPVIPAKAGIHLVSDSLLVDSRWKFTPEGGGNDAVRFYLSLWAWCWAIYYNAYIDLGFEIHGPYFLENGKSLIVRDFHHIKDLPFWPISSKIPFNRVTFHQIYSIQDLHLSFNNILTTSSKAGLGSFLHNTKVVADEKELSESEINYYSKQVFALVREQNEYLNTLSPIVQLKKAAEFTAYSLKDLYQAVGQKPKGVEYVEINLRRFGKRFLEQYHKIEHQSEDYIRQIYDPRNNLLAEDIQKII